MRITAEQKGNNDMADQNLVPEQKGALLQGLAAAVGQASTQKGKNNNGSNLKSMLAKRDEIRQKLAEIREAEENQGMEQLLDGIYAQRWYFIKNENMYVLDSHTGYLWANPEYFPCGPNKTDGYDSEKAAKDVIEKKLNNTRIKGWKIPDWEELGFVLNSWNPFTYDGKIDTGRIKGYGRNYIITKNSYGNVVSWFIGEDGLQTSFRYSLALPCTTALVENKTVPVRGGRVYTQKEIARFVLDLFVEKKLMPIIEDADVAQLYNQLIIEKPELTKQLETLEGQIAEAQKTTLLSSEFDYTAMLTTYDIPAIQSSVIQYYQAVQRWITELLQQLDGFEAEKEPILQQAKTIRRQLEAAYEEQPALTDEENALMAARQKFFKERFALETSSIRNKLMLVKAQADKLEARLDAIDESENSLQEMAALEQEQRASFAFVTENTAKIIKGGLVRIEYFEANFALIKNAIDIWSKWSESYRLFKTMYKQEFEKVSEADGIEERECRIWYGEWQQFRFEMEKMIQPMIERGYIPTIENTPISVAEQCIAALEDYKMKIDTFYMEERRGLYQKYIFVNSGDLQDKFESEGSLYRLTITFQNVLKKIIFNCSRNDDRVFIATWAGALLNSRIDAILQFVEQKELEVTKSVLEEFAELKQKDYETILANEKAYSDEQVRLEKQYNATVFKMRKELAR